MSKALEKNYFDYYGKLNHLHVYPVEFVVRAFLGNYPQLQRIPAGYSGQRVLDVGFGDGRNFPLLHNLGFEVHGVEISQDICDLAAGRMQRLGIPVELAVGRNNSLHYADGFFDCLLACHACYYVDPGTRFADNVAEIARVLRPGGRFVFSAPMASSYILLGARDLGDGHMEIARDPYGVRNGYVLKKFDNAADIEAALSPAFSEFAIGSCRNDFWGIEEHVWIVVCTRSPKVETE